MSAKLEFIAFINEAENTQLKKELIDFVKNGVIPVNPKSVKALVVAKNTVYDTLISKSVLNDAGDLTVIDNIGRKWNAGLWFERSMRISVSESMLENVKTNLDNYNHDLVNASAIPDSSPLCINWQGRVYSNSGKSKKHPALKTALFEGGGGLLHPNCRHQIYPFFEGITELEKIPPNSTTNKKYNETQRLRQNESQIRKWQEKQLKARKSGNAELKRYTNSKVKFYKARGFNKNRINFGYGKQL